jgi:hypothetical protein
LINHGADVNAVADRDLMPLTIAEALPPSSSRDAIIEALQRRYNYPMPQKIAVYIENSLMRFHFFPPSTFRNGCIQWREKNLENGTSSEENIILWWQWDGGLQYYCADRKQ